MFIKEIVRNGKRYDLHLEFVEHSRGEGYLIADLCYPPNADGRYFGCDSARSVMTRAQANATIKAVRGGSNILACLRQLQAQTEMLQEASNYIEAYLL